ncbi:MAG: glycosyltransferase [Candidatus Electryonea clarkiae]|nr:glycosyltransferase [Candidatus Electryonea clarkiae]MDP8285853.1 glycosyltransferase [Candidatus Electryonea clarkiae]
MRASDVIVLPSLREGLPNIGHEALASGKAIIGSNVGGVPELVDDGVTGYLLPPKDVSTLSRALCNLAQNPKKIKLMSENARQKAISELDHRSFAPNVVDLYETVLKEPLTT